MDRREFSHQLQDALAHLYDYPYLESHPLGKALLPSVDARSAGSALHQLLVEAIEGLKPESGLNPDSRPWRQFRYLMLRYVQLETVAETAHQLGVVERQSQNIRNEAIEMLATQLWPHILSWTNSKSGVQSGEPPHPQVGTPDSDFGAEVAYLATISESPGVMLAEVVDSVLATVENLRASKNVIVGMRVPPDLPAVAVRRMPLRQGLLGMVVATLTCGARHLDLSTAVSVTAVELRLLVGAVPSMDGVVGRDSTAATLLHDLRASRPLAQGRHLVHLEGGEVRLQIAPHEHILVTLTLPVVQPEPVLIVDDNVDTLRLLSYYLSEGNYPTIEATNGKQALQLARETGPTAILLDVMMPRQDGWETLQRLRSDPETRDIPVIICSVFDQRDLAFSLGAADVLSKPVSRPALMETLERVLAEKALRGGPRTRME